MTIRIRSVVFRFRALTVLVLLALLCSMASVPSARAATQIVSDCSAASGAAGRLVDVIAAASTGDTITFSCSDTITLSATITIDKNLIIDGTGQNVTLDGQATVRVFYINPGVTATLNRLTITHGSSGNGGGIYNAGTLMVMASTLSNNVASGSGGGITNVGILTVIGSTLWGNTAGSWGGGIYNTVALTITNSTLAANTAYRGGGINGENGSTTNLINSTLSGNTATDVSGNYGGGILMWGTLNFANTIVANSINGWDCITRGLGTIGTNNNNLIEDGTCPYWKNGDPNLGPLQDNGGSTWTMALLPGSQAVDAGINSGCPAIGCPAIDQRGLARSAPYDIGAYEYFPKSITAFSFTTPPAVGVINGTNIAVPVPYSTDVTALVPIITHTGASVNPASGVAQDFTSPVIYTVTAADSSTQAYRVTVSKSCLAYTIAVSNANNSGAGSLRQAIADLCPGGTITFDGDYTIPLTSTLAISKNITISGMGHAVAVSGQDAVQVFTINSGVTATLNDLTIKNGNGGGGNGGGIYNDRATLTLTGCTLSSNFAAQGGGIYNYSGNLSITDSTLSGNSATWSGGGLYNYVGTTTLTNSTFSANRTIQTFGYGGGIYNFGTLRYTNTIVANSTHGGDCRQDGGTIATNTNNLVEDGTCPDSGVNFKTGDPLLGSLQDNGGSTLTFALLAGSPALDAGTNTGCPATDQRGVSRPQPAVSQCDIGAHESTQKEITAFSLASPAATGVFHGTSIAISVPYDTNVTALVPTITYIGASIDPLSSIAQDFTNPMVYTVTASDSSTQAYTVTVTVALNPAKAITAFTILGQIGSSTINEIAGTIAFTVTYGTDVTALVPTITHTGASINPASGAAQNFTSPVIYTVVAADGTTKNYTVTVIFVCNSNITVTNASNSGVGSLRQAITDICAGGTITFSNNYTIALASTLTIDKDMTIDGSGHNVTVSGENVVRVFSVNSSVNATLDSLTITKGNGGVTSGGGINNAGTLTVKNSTLSANFAAEGGGIYNPGILTVVNSILSGNLATWSGGGLDNFGGALTVVNSTLSANATINSFGGGLYNFGTLHYLNTIIANSPHGGDCVIDGGSIATNLNNLVQDGSCSAAFSGDPHLGPLANNGGSTQTFALLPNSPAIDAGDAATCAAAPVNNFDQRGQPRDDLQCDIGAFELEFADSPTVVLAPGAVLRTFGPARMGVQVTAGDPGAIAVTKSTTWATSPGNSILARWAITPTNTTGFTVILKLCWLPAELNGIAPASLLFWRYSSAAWTSFTPTSIDAVAGCATLAGVDGFSSWTLGGVAQPNAVTLRDFTATATTPLITALALFLALGVGGLLIGVCLIASRWTRHSNY